MKWISTTIKRKWLDKILSGEKTIERKGANQYWNKRLSTIHPNDIVAGNVGLNLLCGRESHKFKVKDIILIIHPTKRLIDDTYYKQYWKIEIGDEIMGDDVDNQQDIEERKRNMEKKRAKTIVTGDRMTDAKKVVKDAGKKIVNDIE